MTGDGSNRDRAQDPPSIAGRGWSRPWSSLCRITEMVMEVPSTQAQRARSGLARSRIRGPLRKDDRAMQFGTPGDELPVRKLKHSDLIVGVVRQMNHRGDPLSDTDGQVHVLRFDRKLGQELADVLKHSLLRDQQPPALSG